MARMSSRLNLLHFNVLLVIATLVPTTALAQDVSELRDRLLGAHKNIQIYQATIRHETVKDNGRWRLTRQFDVAFDRSASSLRIDRPDMLLISDGRFLRYRSTMIPGRHLEQVLSEPLSNAFLTKAAPFLASHPMPDVTLLLGSDPIPARANIIGTAWDSFGRPGIQYEIDDMRVSLYMDSTTNLLAQMQIEKESSIERGQQVGPITIVYDITIQKLNEQFEQEWFEFNTANSQSVTAWGDLLSSGEEDATELKGKRAPSIELDDRSNRLFRLKSADKDIIVLTFWASWGGPPCYRALPQIQAVSDWADQESLPVGVYTINVREKEDEIAPVWQIKSLTMPVLLDKRGAASRAYRVGPLPQTVIIHDGKVAYVHVGSPKNMEGILKSEINALLQQNSVSRK